MNLYGYEVPPAVEAGALALMREHQTFPTALLIGYFRGALPSSGYRGIYVNRTQAADRAADRIITREKKNGNIEPAGKIGRLTYWRMTTQAN